MRKYYLLLILFTAVIPFTCRGQFAIPDMPADKAGVVYDYADVLTNAHKQDLEEKLNKNADLSYAKIIIATVNDLKGERAEKVAPEWAHKWNTVNKDPVSDIFILVSIDDRDMFIATGFGVQSRLPDSALSAIIQDNILPEFKNRAYYEGLDKGTDAILKILGTKAGTSEKAVAASEKAGFKIDKNSPLASFLVWGVVAILGFIILRTWYNHYKTRRVLASIIKNTKTFSSSGQSNFSRNSNSVNSNNNGPDYDYEYVRDYNRYYGRPPESYQRFKREGIFGALDRKLNEINNPPLSRYSSGGSSGFTSRRSFGSSLGDSSGSSSGFTGGFSGGGAGGSW